MKKKDDAQQATQYELIYRDGLQLPEKAARRSWRSGNDDKYPN